MGKAVVDPEFQKGDEIVIVSQRDQVGIVIREPRLIAGEWWYCISFGARRMNVPESSLERFIAAHDPISLLRQNVFGPRESLSKVVTFMKLRQPLQNNLYSYRASRTEFYEYQFKPLVKILSSPKQRLLIADEVGLGKTIEAGFIYQELNARNRLERVLVVCRSNLRTKWQEEMRRRFGEEFAILDGGGIRNFLASIERLGRGVELRGICSLETLRGDAVHGRIQEVMPTFDLVIVDESHHMRNSGTLSYKLGLSLSQLAEAMLLLTATPIHLGNEDLFNLLRVLDPEEFEDLNIFQQVLSANRIVIEVDRTIRKGSTPNLGKAKAILTQVEATPVRERFMGSPIYQRVLRKLEEGDGGDRAQVIEIQRDLAQLNLLGHIMNRTKKREVLERQPKRQASVIKVEWSAEEEACYNAVTSYCRRWARSKLENLGIASWFPVITLQRQLASSIPATLQHYLQAGTGDKNMCDDMELSEWEMEDFAEDPEDIPEDRSLREDPYLLRILREAGERIRMDSKFEALTRQLHELDKAEPGRKILIFSYFKKTLEYLYLKLKDLGFVCVLMTGDVPSRPNDPENDERGKRLLRFRDDPEVRIMLSSEVGSEGLDFQFAHIVVNYDLPWNPMVVEQRIGRVDRIGQKSARILIFNFAIRGTIEERILQRLYNRIRIFEESIGDLESILGTEIRDLTLKLLTSELTPEEEEERIENSACVIERRRQELSELESRAVEFIGQDAYFHGQLEEVRNKRRYVTADELEVLISDFVRKECPASTFESGDAPGVFNLRLDREFARLVRETAGKKDAGGATFANRASDKGMRVTCRGEVAFEREDVELLTGQHVLIRTILGYYEAHQDRLHPAASVWLDAGNGSVGVGDYLYFLFLVEEYSAIPGKTLEAVFLEVSEGSALAEEESEVLLSRLVVEARTAPRIEISPMQVDDLYGKALDVFGQRLQTKKKTLLDRNADIVTRRLGSIEATYIAKRNKVTSLLENARIHNRQPRYIRMLEGTLRNIDSEHEDRKLKIEAGRRVDLQWELFAAGVVRVS